MSKLEFLVSEFQRLYGARPEHIARAPGRVNLIGEHTDYNDGFVMPIAIDREVLIAARPRHDRLVCITATDIAGSPHDEFSLDAIKPHPQYRWANYVRGVADQLQQARSVLRGMDAVIASTLPTGAGLSSSAALEVCTATILQAFGEPRFDGVTLAQLCQRAENDFVGVKSGIMDQYAAALGQADKALIVDCRALTYQAVSLPRGVTVVVADTRKKRQLVGSDYNTRRAECQDAVALLSQLLDKPFQALRDVSLSDFNGVAAQLPENLGKRARHVLTENERVEQAARAAQRDDAVEFGRLMNESQTSLREDYAASSPELEMMVALARQQTGCLGSRLTGAGWGGATVNLVREANVPSFIQALAQQYQSRTGIAPWVSPVRASPGATLVK
ncbi:MAG: galactokinase [Chloroflexi bacterium]|nr:galactokinase [Chloroflexota bacterium]